MSRRRLRRRVEKQQRQAPALFEPLKGLIVVREAVRVERLVYTRTQAAQALGISRSTLNRRVLPLIETVVMPWGARLIPVDELERVLAEHRQVTRAPRGSRGRPGRKLGLSREVVARIRDEHEKGRSLGEIARGLDADRVPTSQGGRRWWPSTVRSVLDRA